MRTSQSFFASLLLAACGVSTLVNLSDRDSEFSAAVVAEIFGGAIAISLLPLFISAVTILKPRKRKKECNFSGSWAAFATASLMLFVSHGYSSDEKFWPHSNSAFFSEKCGAIASFPSDPETRTLQTKLGPVEYAELKTIGTYFRAECAVLPLNGPPDKSLILSLLKEFSEREGLSGATYEADVTGGRTTGTVRGNKKISGIWVTYQSNFIIFDNNLLTATVAGLSSEFPSPKMLEFLNSLGQKK